MSVLLIEENEVKKTVPLWEGLISNTEHLCRALL